MFIRKSFFLPILMAILIGVGSMIFLYYQFEEKPNKLLSPAQEPIKCDLLIKNGTIIDGSGQEAFQGDVALSGDKIVKIGTFPAEAVQTIDAKGMIVAPGFINPHSHLDQTILSEPDALASLMQGVTFELVGLDGLSPLDLDAHFSQVSEKGIGVNYGSLIGQGSIRRAVMGNSSRKASPEEIFQMQSLVKQGMEQGAFGLSTGLEYLPGKNTSTSEIIELAKTAAQYNGVYVSHIRNEKDRVVEAVKEALEIGRAGELPVVISHIKVGSSVYNASREKRIERNTRKVIEEISSFRQEGGKAYADIYPYLVTWYQINRKPSQVVWKYPANLLLVSFSTNQEYVGKTVAEIAETEGVSQGTVAQRLINDPAALICFQNLSENSMQQLLKSPFTVVGMDNTTYWEDPTNIPPTHPRNYGTFPRILGPYVRNGLLTLEEAVYKMTGQTATIYGISKRGLIREGYFADLVVFDPETVEDRATYSNPEAFPQGIDFVIVNGKVAIEQGKPITTTENAETHPSGVRAGQILRHTSVAVNND